MKKKSRRQPRRTVVLPATVVAASFGCIEMAAGPTNIYILLICTTRKYVTGCNVGAGDRQGGAAAFSGHKHTAKYKSDLFVG